MIFTTIPPAFASGSAGQALLVVLLAVVAAGLVLQGLRKLRGTTLIAPGCWLLGALLVIAAAELACMVLHEPGQRQTADLLRYAAATTTVCPLMALLGAKRPQDGPWQLIVFSLWCVLTLPAVHTLLLRRGQVLEISLAISWFMLILIAVGILNAALTKYWLAAVVFAAGQSVLLAGQLPLPGEWAGSLGPFRGLVGLACLALAVGVAKVAVRTRRRPDDPLDRLWLDFRDSFGVLWGLRLAERVNASAAMYDWSIVLSWRGFHGKEGEKLSDVLPPETAKVFRQNLENLLRRFVSRAWIAVRLDERVD